MRRVINQINVSITTNRTCTLRCDHCYIAPHLFDDKSQMSERTFRLIFDRVEELYALDKNLEEIEWEAIGGETTMMPFEWWERQLPWALDRISQINKGLRAPGALNFLTNLIYKDKRYTDLFNEYAEHPAFCLYTSWEPDTQRFGKRNQLFGRFYDTLCSLKAKDKILDIILTKEVIKIGAERILEMFVPAGVTDFSMKMISPYGSGKEFFEPNMADFQSMTEFFRDMKRHKPAHVTFTPEEEMLSSLMRGTSFQCNGNFKYDLSIEPDGSCHFNANQTANEAALGFRTLVIDDPSWAVKLCFENKTEENNKLSLNHKQCDQCEYMSYCNAGWYHYKIADPALIAPYNQEECSGYKAFWDDTKQYLGNQVLDRSSLLHRNAIREKLVRSTLPYAEVSVRESDLPVVYNEYFKAIQPGMYVELDQQIRFGKNLLERIWFYEDVGIKTFIDSSLLSAFPLTERIFEHYLYGNYKRLYLSDSQILERVKAGEGIVAKRLGYALYLLTDISFSPAMGNELVIDSRNEELLRFAILLCKRNGYPLTHALDGYLQKLVNNLQIEGGLNGGGSN